MILLEPLTHFFDEDVTWKEARLLFERVLRRVRTLTQGGPMLLAVQTVPAHDTPRRRFGRDLLRLVDVGLRLRPGDAPWSVALVKPTSPEPAADGGTDGT